MPIHKLPNGKYKWGEHGKEYDTRAGAEAQAQAAYANGYREKGAQSKLHPMTAYQDEEGKWGVGSQGNIYDTKEEAEAAARQDAEEEDQAKIHGQKSLFSKPPKLEACVRRLIADPNFKPQNKNDTKEQAAYAVCQGTLAKAIEDIQEAIIILKHFEEDDEYSLLDPSDYDTYGDNSSDQEQEVSDVS